MLLWLMTFTRSRIWAPYTSKIVPLPSPSRPNRSKPASIRVKLTVTPRTPVPRYHDFIYISMMKPFSNAFLKTSAKAVVVLQSALRGFINGLREPFLHLSYSILDSASMCQLRASTVGECEHVPTDAYSAIPEAASAALAPFSPRNSRPP